MNNPINAIQASPKMSAHYGFISSEQILETMADKGWKPIETKMGKGDGFQKHLIKFEHEQLSVLEGLPGHHATKLQIAALNSHDGTTAFRMFMGALRIACLNGVLAGDAFAQYRVIHSQNMIKGIHDGIDAIVSRMPEYAQQIKKLCAIELSPAAQDEYIKRCYDEALRNTKRVVQVHYAARPIRYQDKENDAYTLFNKVQEKLIRGGIQYLQERDYLDAQGNVVNTYVQRGTTRGRASVAENIRLNQFAYNTIMELAA